jgi:PKD repeat protein
MNGNLKIFSLIFFSLIALKSYSQLQIDDVDVTDVALCYGDATGEIEITASGGTPPITYSVDGGSSFQAGNQFVGLTSGTYEIRVKDLFQTIIYSSPVFIDQPDEIQIPNQDHTNVTGCFGNTNGTISVDAIGGTGALFYSIDGGLTYPFPEGSTAVGLGAGSYDIMVIDANGCEVSGIPITITQPLELEITGEGATDVFPCNGADNGTIQITSTGGTAPIEYSIDNGTSFQSGAYFAPLTPGNYDVVVRDVNGCTVNGSTLTVDEPAILTIDSQIPTDITTCHGDNTGEILVVASGGTGTLRYAIDGGGEFLYISGNSATGLSTGNYEIVVRDDNSCTVIGDILTINEPSEIFIDSVSTTHIEDCFGDADGEIVIWAKGGVAPLEYSIDNGVSYQFSNTFSGLTAGTYECKVIDSQGCENAVIETVEITQPSQVSMGINDITVTDVFGCFGDNTGEIQMTASGGTYPYSFSIDGGLTYPYTYKATNLPAGIYDVYVQDANNCTYHYISSVVEILQPEIVDVDSYITENPECFGGFGSAIITATGGSGSYFYSVDGGSTYLDNGGIFNDLSAGVFYQIYIKDTKNCIAPDATFILFQPPELVFDDIVVEDVDDCFGGTNGSIEISVSGGTPPYQFSIDLGNTWQVSNIFLGLESGNYYIRVKDDNDCLLIDPGPRVIDQPGPVNVTFQTHSHIEGCNGDDTGEIHFDALGGTEPFTYYITGPVNLNNATGDFIDLPAGTYNLSVEDDNGCTAVGTPVTITEPDVLTVSLGDSQDVLCYGDNTGIINIHSDGGQLPHYYSIDGGSSYVTGSYFSGLYADDTPGYQIAVIDHYGCETIGEFVPISQPDSLSVDAVNITNVEDCWGDDDGIIEISVTGGITNYNYSINNGGTYHNNGGLFTNLEPDIYYVKVQDSNFCTAFWDEDGDQFIDPVEITQPTRIQINEVITDAILCNGDNNGRIEIDAEGGTGSLHYSIDGGSSFQDLNIFENLSSGTYLVLVRDDNGCETDIFNAYIYEPADLEFNNITVTDEECPGENNGTINIFILGGTAPYRFSADGGTTWQQNKLITDLAPGDYTPAVIDTNGCMIVYPDLVTIQEAEYEALVNAQPIIGCSPLDVLFTRESPGYVEEWDFGDGNFNISETTSVTHTYINNGETPQTFTAWAHTRSEAPYFCVDSMSIDITVLPAPQISFTVNPDTAYFPNSNISFDNTSNDGLDNFYWDFDNGMTSDLNEPGVIYYDDCGEYQIQMSAENSWCRDTVNQLLLVTAYIPEAVLLVDTTQSCVPVTIQFENQSQYTETIEWDLGDGTITDEDSFSHTYDTPGEYIVTLDNYGYCDTYSTTSQTISVFSSPVVDFTVSPDTVMLPNQPIHAYNLSSNDSELFFWEFGDGGTSEEENPIHYYTQEGTYPVSLTVISINKCVDSLTQLTEIVVLPAGEIVFPNSFYPDYIEPMNVFKADEYRSVKSFEMRIYNRWGETMFYTNDIDVGWNGKVNGDNAIQDVYVWRAEGMYLNGTPFEMAGSVTLIR